MTEDADARRDAVVDRFLSQNGVDDAELYDALAELRAETRAVIPEPSAELHALMGKSSPVISLASRRHRSVLLVAVAVTASLGLGVSAAAAVSPDFRAATGATFSAIVHAIVPATVAHPPKKLPGHGVVSPTPTTSPAVPTKTPTSTPQPESPGKSGESHRPSTPPPHPGKVKHTPHPHPAHP